MEDDCKFWLGVMKIIATVICVFILTAGGCSSYTQYLVSLDLEKGIDPLMVGCVHNSGSSAVDQACTFAVVKR